MSYVITGEWLCDQADILCDELPSVIGPVVLCDGIGAHVPDTPTPVPVVHIDSVLTRPTRPHVYNRRTDSPGVYRRKR